MTVGTEAAHGLTSGDLVAADLARFQHGDESQPADPPFILTRGVGSTVWDLDGRAYLDAHAGAWLCQIGHGRPEMAQAAADQIGALEHFTTHSDYRNPPAIALAERLVALSPIPDGRVRYSCTGSEADDDALQTVRAYQLARGLPSKSAILTLRGAYHGHTYGGLELSGRLEPAPGRTTIQLTMPDEAHPERFHGQDVTDYCVAELRAVLDQVGADSIAAMFGEPVFGPAGMFAPPPDYWPRMAEVLREHDILLVADEVVTAFGRCGQWYGCELSGVVPDVIVLAKGIASGYAPLGAIIISAEISRTLAGYHHGGSYAGHAVACALALKNLEIIESEGLLAASRERGAQLLAGLDSLRERFPAVRSVRGVGLMVSLWLDSSRARSTAVPLDTLVRRAAGLIVMGGYDRLVITPPLVVTEAEVGEIVRRLGDVIGAVYH